MMVTSLTPWRSWAFYLTGVFEKSIFYLEKAVSIMPNDATLNDHLGDAYWKHGRKRRQFLSGESSHNRPKF